MVVSIICAVLLPADGNLSGSFVSSVFLDESFSRNFSVSRYHRRDMVDATEAEPLASARISTQMSNGRSLEGSPTPMRLWKAVGCGSATPTEDNEGFAGHQCLSSWAARGGSSMNSNADLSEFIHVHAVDDWVGHSFPGDLQPTLRSSQRTCRFSFGIT